jgi:Arc/MetJ-type ribon-helix-helix transcriptional regulator
MMPGSYYDTEEETGNPVPVGSLPEEVADDISAFLSEGEYVLPSDVVRWHGLKHIQDMMVEAKAGLMSMDMMGQLHDTEGTGEEYEEEEEQGEEEYETPEGNDVEVATVETEEEVLDEDEDEEAKTVSYAFKSTPKVAFIR